MQQVLVYSDSLILIPRGPIARKFTDAAGKSAGLADAYRDIASELGCDFFDADQHERLGRALAACVAGLSGFSPLAQR